MAHGLTLIFCLHMSIQINILLKEYAVFFISVKKSVIKNNQGDFVKLKIVLLVGLFPLLGLASGNVNSTVKFPGRAKTADMENQKCEANESLKACMDRVKSIGSTK